MCYVKVYNREISQKTLGYLSPIAAPKEWAKKEPDLFKKRVYNLRGLDTLCTPELWMQGQGLGGVEIKLKRVPQQ